jgi:hypothetical protein
MNHQHLRDSWTAYAEEHGLLPRQADGTTAMPAAAPGTPQGKYGAIAVTVDGRRFDSKKEAAVYMQLRLMEKAGAIAELHCQTAWPLHILELWRNSCPPQIKDCGVYHSDFDYLDLRTGEFKVIDVKSEPTRRKVNYRLKKRIVEAVHGITIDDGDLPY